MLISQPEQLKIKEMYTALVYGCLYNVLCSLLTIISTGVIMLICHQPGQQQCYDLIWTHFPMAL